MWRVSHPIMKSAHQKIVTQIQENNLESKDMFKKTNSNMFIPENNNVIVQDDQKFVMMATQA